MLHVHLLTLFVKLPMYAFRTLVKEQFEKIVFCNAASLKYILWGYFMFVITMMLNFRSSFSIGLVVACVPGNPNLRTTSIISNSEFDLLYN